MRPQDYVTDNGRMTTNTVEGFHGLALMYRDKRTDLGHTHYICKTNMAICHKVNSYFWTLVIDTSITHLPLHLHVECRSYMESFVLSEDGCANSLCCRSKHPMRATLLEEVARQAC